MSRKSQTRAFSGPPMSRSSWVVSHELNLDDAPDGYEHFDRRDLGWTKVVIHPGELS